MGSGEFGGGGSVKWQVQYQDNEKTEPPPGNAKFKAHGKDVGPDTAPGDKLYVVCKNARVLSLVPGSVIVEVTLTKEHDEVVLKWGADIGPDLRDLTKA